MDEEEIEEEEKEEEEKEEKEEQNKFGKLLLLLPQKMSAKTSRLENTGSGGEEIRKHRNGRSPIENQAMQGI